MIFFTPLEQFEILVFIPLEVSGYDFSITNMTLYLFFVMLFGLLMFWFGFIYNPEFIPVRFQLILEISYSFVLSLVKQQAGTKVLDIFLYFLVYLCLFCYQIYLD